MRTVRLLLPALALGLLTAALLSTPLTGATFTSRSTDAVRVTAAADWTPPVVAVTSLGTALTGSVNVAATATDSGTGVASVAIQYSVTDSGTWQTMCLDLSSPYSCAWNTTTVGDGSYDLRAVATDNAGLTTTSSTVTTRVVNNVKVVLSTVPDPVGGTITLTATNVNPGLLPLSLYFQYVPAGGNNWTSVPGCGYNVTTATSRTCSWTPGSTGDYDIRAVGTNLVNTYYDAQYGVTMDNTAPTATLTVPAGTLTGAVRLSATADDADTSVANVVFQERVTGGATWNTLCSLAATPYTCLVDTTKLAQGSHDFRLVATDVVGNSVTTASQSRTVDNTAPSVAVTGPVAGTVVRGIVPLTASASSPQGVSKVVFEVRPTSSGAWTPVCTSSTSPYSCGWDSTTITGGSYDLHAVLTDGGGVVTTSTTVTVSVDNSPLHGQDVQAVNTTTVGKPASGDQLVLTYSGQVDPGTVLSGWTGASTPVTVTFKDKVVAGGPVAGLDYASFGTANLGQVAFAQDYVRSKKSAAFNATMTAATKTVGGVQVTVVTVTLGSTTQGANLRTSSAAGAMTWVPSASAKSTTGVACSTSPVTESGPTDQDL